MFKFYIYCNFSAQSLAAQIPLNRHSTMKKIVEKFVLAAGKFDDAEYERKFEEADQFLSNWFDKEIVTEDHANDVSTKGLQIEAAPPKSVGTMDTETCKEVQPLEICNEPTPATVAVLRSSRSKGQNISKSEASTANKRLLLGFENKKVNEQANYLLNSLKLSPNVLAEVTAGQLQLRLSHICNLKPENVSDIFSHEIDYLSIVQNNFTSQCLQYLQTVIEKKKKVNNVTRKICQKSDAKSKLISCNSCLNFYHNECDNIIQKL